MLAYRKHITLFSASTVAGLVALSIYSKRALTPPFILKSKWPSSDLMDLITKSSAIAKRNGYLVSFESEQISIISDDIPFTATLALNLSQKPKSKNTSKSTRNPFLAPFIEGSHVCDVDEYRILLNKYNVVSNHILIVTKDFVPQSEPLNARDFETAWRVITAMNGLCYFNCGPRSGASQPHKHLQVIPRESQIFPIDGLLQNLDSVNSEDGLYRIKEYPFIHRVFLIESEMISMGDRLQSAYLKMMNAIREEIDAAGQYAEYLDEDVFSYNVIMTESYMFMVARRSDVFFDEEQFGANVNVGVNAVTFTGSFFVKSEQSLAMLKKAGPIRVLQSVSFEAQK